MGDGAIALDATAEQLAGLAAERPELWPEILEHPNLYPDLAEWIRDRLREQGAADAAPSTAARSDGAAVAAPVEGGASGDSGAPKRRHRLAVIGVLVGALLLGGTAAALAATGKLQEWVGGGGASTGESAEARAASFAEGIGERWAVTGTDLADDGEFRGYMPRMMGPINPLRRADQPVQLESGVLVQYAPSSGPGDVANDWALLDAETGEPVWTEPSLGSGGGCAVNDAGTEAACVIAFVASNEIVRFGADGVLSRFDAEPGAVHYEGERLVVQQADRATSYDFDGGVVDEAPLAQTSAAAVGNTESPDCVSIYAAGTEALAGPACDDPEALTGAEAFNWAVIDQEEPKILIDTADRVSVFDARTHEIVWEGEGTVPGWYRSPQLVRGEGGDGLLLQRAAGNTPFYVIVNLETGEEVEIGEPVGDSIATLAGDEVLLFSGEPPYGDPLNRVAVFDPRTGEKLAEHDLPAIDDAAEVLGGPDGALVGHRMCTDCTTAEGSGIIDRYTFLGASEAGGSDGEGTAAIPAGLPFDCPADTVLLAWAELEDGWVLVCGASPEQPTHMQVRLSDGSLEGTSSEVRWDADRSRYIGSFDGDLRYTLDYDLGTLTVRDMGARRTLAQEPLVRYVFVILGEEERTADDVAGTSGAFDVDAPKETSEDQVRYMIEVLEKAYEGRALVKDALPKLQGCTASAGGYGDTVTQMEAVRDNRAELLEALASMPVDKIPEGQQLLDDLTDAIAFSHEANVEYVDWAERANASGCATLSAEGLSAANASDAPKERFAERWNRAVAPEFDVRTFDAWYI